jgi:8-oxo-dGTP pyrophosphatase MutT (NUDIX family)
MNESIEAALEREIQEETGWQLRRIVALVADWEWEHGGIVRRELDYLVEVEGDLTAPQLEALKHDAYAWIGLDSLELMMEGRTDGNRTLRNIVAQCIDEPTRNDPCLTPQSWTYLKRAPMRE